VYHYKKAPVIHTVIARLFIKGLVLILQVHTGRFIVQIGMERYNIFFLCSVFPLYIFFSFFFPLMLPQLIGGVSLLSDKEQTYVN